MAEMDLQAGEDWKCARCRRVWRAPVAGAPGKCPDCGETVRVMLIDVRCDCGWAGNAAHCPDCGAEVAVVHHNGGGGKHE
jgi:DNA-directed RNA polymerase subunit RPC12/RpoP